jgi:hypothetical protein
MQDIHQLAKKFIEGEWQYDAANKTLKKSFASNKELSELDLIDEEGYLDFSLKLAITNLLGSDVLTSDIVGPFGDKDIFSGDTAEDEIFYNIELCNISESTIEALQKISNILISNTSSINC